MVLFLIWMVSSTVVRILYHHHSDPVAYPEVESNTVETNNSTRMWTSPPDTTLKLVVTFEHIVIGLIRLSVLLVWIVIACLACQVNCMLEEEDEEGHGQLWIYDETRWSRDQVRTKDDEDTVR